VPESWDADGGHRLSVSAPWDWALPVRANERDIAPAQGGYEQSRVDISDALHWTKGAEEISIWARSTEGQPPRQAIAQAGGLFLPSAFRICRTVGPGWNQCRNVHGRRFLKKHVRMLMADRSSFGSRLKHRLPNHPPDRSRGFGCLAGKCRVAGRHYRTLA